MPKSRPPLYTGVPAMGALVKIERGPEGNADLAQRLADPHFARQGDLERASFALPLARTGAAGRQRSLICVRVRASRAKSP